MSFKAFDLGSDVASVISSINEVVTISSSLFVMGTGDVNVKKFTNISSGSVPLGGYWQTVFDSSPTVSTSTPLLDMTFGYHVTSSYNVAAGTASSQNEKIKVYREMANALMGDPDAEFDLGTSTAPECFFIMVKRGLQKDELKKGSVDVRYSSGTTFNDAVDAGADTSFQQTVGGDYGWLVASGTNVGQVWYNAGVIVIGTRALFSGTTGGVYPNWSGSADLSMIMSTLPIDSAVDGLRDNLIKLSFNNQTNLYSTIYFCRATNSEFNYSSNPTFVDDSKRILVTSGSSILTTRTYITTIGLYDANDNLLAVAKVNKPITKSPDNEATFKIRLDY
jgi:hypothetical protein